MLIMARLSPSKIKNLSSCLGVRQLFSFALDLDRTPDVML